MGRMWLAALCALTLAGCREDDGPMGGNAGGVLFVDSSPAGGLITLDGRSTGRHTPDTVRGVAGLRTVRVALDTLGLTYSYNAQVVVSGTGVTTLTGPLMARCTQETTVCAQPFHDEHVVGNVRFGSNALGALFLVSGSGGGLFWPAGTDNSYMSTGTPVFAGMVEQVAVSTGVYDTEVFAGRPAPRVTVGAGSIFTLAQHAWILPPPGAAALTVARGIEVREKLAASPTLEGVFLLQLTFTNITTDPLYRIVDPVGEQGITYRNAYVGLALDPDIGRAEDDWASYDEVNATVYAYDASFVEQDFATQQTSPSLVGLRVASAPAGTGVVLNAYANQSGTSLDWHAGTPTQASGYGMLSGTAVLSPDHARPALGHLPPNPGDVRILATVGPLQLAPGESATVTFAIALGAPAAGTYTSGQTVQPGEPTDETRALHRIAANLRARLAAADQLRGVLGQ